MDDLLGQLDMKGQVRLLRDLRKLRAEGNQLRSHHTDSFGDGLHELRTPYDGMIFRHLFCYHPSERWCVVVLLSFEKKSQKTPQGHIDQARHRMKILQAQQEMALGSVNVH